MRRPGEGGGNEPGGAGPAEAAGALSQRGDWGPCERLGGLAHELNALSSAGGASRGAAATLLQGRR